MPTIMHRLSGIQKVLGAAAFTISVVSAVHSKSLFSQAPPSPAHGAPAALSGDSTGSGRKQLSAYLDHIAAGQTSARRQAIAGITKRASAVDRQHLVRGRILSLLGPMPERTPLQAHITGSTQMDGFRLQKILFESQPNFPVTALLYLPGPGDKAGTERLPAILISPGHSPAGKAGDFAIASAFARAGFAVLSYDPIGQGERLQYPDPAHPGASLAGHPTGEHGEAGIQPTLIGDAVALYFLWDAVRAVDYLQSRPEIDPSRIGAFGCSGGGAITALAAALDNRIAVAATACYITSYDTLLPAMGPQDAEQTIPNFLSGLRPPGTPAPAPLAKNSAPAAKQARDKAPNLDFPDWVELAAPRPYAIISTTSDMFPFAGAQATEAEARRFYGLFGADKDLAFLTGPGGHGNLRPILPDILAFFTKYLHPPASARSVSAVAAPPPDKTASTAGKADRRPTSRGAPGHPHRPGLKQLSQRRDGAHPYPQTSRQDSAQGTHTPAAPGGGPRGDPQLCRAGASRRHLQAHRRASSRRGLSAARGDGPHPR